jgi:predicted RNA binding protein YcfA (HicA-like mRNA interferase family)
MPWFMSRVATNTIEGLTLANGETVTAGNSYGIYLTSNTITNTITGNTSSNSSSSNSISYCYGIYLYGNNHNNTISCVFGGKSAAFTGFALYIDSTPSAYNQITNCNFRNWARYGTGVFTTDGETAMTLPGSSTTREEIQAVVDRVRRQQTERKQVEDKLFFRAYCLVFSLPSGWTEERKEALAYGIYKCYLRRHDRLVAQGLPDPALEKSLKAEKFLQSALTFSDGKDMISGDGKDAHGKEHSEEDGQFVSQPDSDSSKEHGKSKAREKKGKFPGRGATGKEVAAFLERQGFQKVKGADSSHQKYRHPDGRQTEGPIHGSKGLKTKTYNSIKTQIKFDEEG